MMLDTLWQHRTQSLDSLAGFRLADRADQRVPRRFGMAVSGNLFDMLGVQLVLGRAIGSDEDRIVEGDLIVIRDHEL